ncbi:MAG: hypothetical protein JKY88_10790, partial [Pseudomonadales bacterium]|nr:hypothetical protein [Pseudomonadales bacterium]
EGSLPKSTEEGIDDETKGFLVGEAKGFQAGESAGREQGLRDVRAELEKSFDDEIKDKRALMTNLLSLFQTPPDRKDEIESSLIALITQVAEVVILSELKANPVLIGRLVNHAMAALPHGARNLKVQVNPSNVEFLQAEMNDQNIEYIPNRNLSIGSCQIQSETSSVDAKLAERIHDSLVKVFSSESVETISESTLLKIGDEIDSEC